MSSPPKLVRFLCGGGGTFRLEFKETAESPGVSDPPPLDRGGNSGRSTCGGGGDNALAWDVSSEELIVKFLNAGCLRTKGGDCTWVGHRGEFEFEFKRYLAIKQWQS